MPEHVTRDRPTLDLTGETTATVDAAVRDAVHDTQAVRQAKALLELRELARHFDGLADGARRAAQDALHHKVDLALGNGATMAQVAAMMADGAGIDREDRQRLRRITGQVPAGYGGRHDHTATMGELLDDLERAVDANRQACDAYELDRQTLHRLQADVAAMRRVFNLPLPPQS